MNYVPHDYQRHCTERIVEESIVGLFLDMGLGKTVITLTAINELRYERCPRSEEPRVRKAC